ncbi:M20 metallopeptidase family protein [Thermosipho atlanticus]|uniref:N-acetyldiaminopimelate deacetylase n=1 Tax=Thermosipho atlanticus DSM 15807 TaxID=1123380 RepID=A0A1M5T3J1_9BACT|nr:M20 family metallopeptidase [Thermosipho atlanticus]SHH45317.1 N-acetyldiaminopimelate deacetylase [Thermosipho atlanticus DSM 15807]
MNAIELRHILHQNPEISFHEFETQKILIEALKSLNDERLKVYKIAGTGVLAIYEVMKNNPFILYRADMDALPIKEETDWKYAAKNGNMHACGHDVHMSIAYDLIQKILSSNLNENFIFIFQPGEETGAGASYVLEEIEELPIKYAFALHVTDEYDFKTVATTPGILFAAATEIDLTFTGKSAHIAFYEQGIDSIKITMQFLNEFYKRKFKDTLVGFGKIEGGNARNIVSKETTIFGSIRTPSLEHTEEIIDEISKIAHEISNKHLGGYLLTKGSIYPQVEVNEKLYNSFKDFVSRNEEMRFINCGMKYTGEDFGYFSLRYPSLMFWAGTLKGERVGLHNSKFLPDDDVIEFYSSFVYSFLKELIESEREV